MTIIKNKKIVTYTLITLLFVALSVWLVISFTQKETSSTVEHKIELFENEEEIKRLEPFFQRLEKDNFAVTEFEQPQRLGFHDCQLDQKYIFNGTGIRSFLIKQKKPIKISDNNYYVRFNVNILTFSSTEQAKEYKEKIEASFSYYREIKECIWDKSPHHVVYNGKSVFYLRSGAEMFRTELNKYGDLLEKMK